mgnify:CR=1 FL=1
MLLRCCLPWVRPQSAGAMDAVAGARLRYTQVVLRLLWYACTSMLQLLYTCTGMKQLLLLLLLLWKVPTLLLQVFPMLYTELLHSTIALQ